MNDDLCKKWLSDKNKNPINNRKIKLNGLSYKKFSKLCDTNNNIKITLCKKWIKNKNKNPITNGKIIVNGPIYQKYSTLCYNKKILNIFNPIIKRVTKYIIDRINYFVIINNYINKIKKNSDNNCIKKINDELKLGEKIILDKQIGNIGKYGVVYKAHYNSNKIFKFAVKICEINDINKKEIEVCKKINKILIDMKCPHFLFLYGFLTCNSISDIPIPNKAFLLINELADSTFSQLIKDLIEDLDKNNIDNNLLNKIVRNAIVQIYISIIFFNKYSNYNHNDTHFNNFLYHKINEGGYFHYCINDKDYYIENIGYLWVINDFGLASDLESNKSDLIFFTKSMLDSFANKNINDCSENKKNIKKLYTFLSKTLNNFFEKLLKLLLKKTSTINDIIIFINKEFKTDFLTTNNKPDNIINKIPYIIE